MLAACSKIQLDPQLRPQLLALKLQILEACRLAGSLQQDSVGPTVKAPAAGPRTSDPRGLLAAGLLAAGLLDLFAGRLLDWLACETCFLVGGLLACKLTGFVEEGL